MTTEDNPDAPNWLRELEAKRERRVKAKLGHETGAGSPCLNCKDDCPGLDLHFWRKICKNCKCGKESHDVQDDDINGYAQFQLLGSKPNKSNKIVLPGKKEEIELEWTPKGQKEAIDKYLKTLPPELLPVKGSTAAQERKQLLQKQIPLHDIDPTLCDALTEDEVKQMNDYISNIKENIVGVGQIVQLNTGRGTLRDRSPKRPNKNFGQQNPGGPFSIPDLNRLNLEDKHPENTKNLPVFIPNTINRKDDEVFPVFPKIHDKTFPFASRAFNEKFEAPTPYTKLPFTPNAKLENSFPVGGPQPKFATVLSPNNRSIEDVNRLPLGFREQFCVISPDGERLAVCTNNKYYDGPNGEKLVQSPNGERFYVNPDDGRYALGPRGEKFMIGANGEKYYEDPQDPRFVLDQNGDKCFVPKEKFNVNSKGERYQQDPDGQVYFAEPDNDRYVTDDKGRRYIVAPNGSRFPVDTEDGRLATDPTKNQKFLVGPKNEKYIQDPNDKNILVGPNGERYIFPKDKYQTSPYGERFLTGPNNQKYFADPNDDRYCLGPQGERYRVAPGGALFRVDDKDGRYLVDPKTGRNFMMGPRGGLFERDPSNPDYVVGEKGDRHFVGEDIFQSEPNGVRYIEGPNGMKYFADPLQERRAVGPDGEKYLVGPDNELFPVDPLDKRFGRDSSGNKMCLGPNGEIFYSDPADDRFVIAPDGLKYFVPKNFTSTTPDGEKVIRDANGQVYKVDPKDDRYALAGPSKDRFLIGPDGRVYPLDKNDGRFCIDPKNERVFFGNDGKVYRRDPEDENCVIAPNGDKFYLPNDRYKTGPNGERYILNDKNERCIPSQDNDAIAINPKGRKYRVTKNEIFPVSNEDGRFLEDPSGRKFILGANGEKYYQDRDPNYVKGPENQRIPIPADKYHTANNGERFLENPYGQKYYPSKDDNILIGPNGEKRYMDEHGNLHKISPEDGRFFEDDNGNRFILNDGKHLKEKPNGTLDVNGKEYTIPRDRYKTAANGERYIQGPRGEKYVPDVIDDNYAIRENGDRYLVANDGNLYPVDTEDGRFARGPNGERFLLDSDGNLYYPDPFDEKYVIGPNKQKYFLPKDKFITAPTGERFLQGPDGKKYLPDPQIQNLAIAPDGSRLFVDKNRELVPLDSIKPIVEDLYPQDTYDRFIYGPNREIYTLDPEDGRFCTSPEGGRYLVGEDGTLYPVDKRDNRYAIAPEGNRFIMGPNYEKYYEEPGNPGYVIGPDGERYTVAEEDHVGLRASGLRSPTKQLHNKKDPRFFTDPQGNDYVETLGGTKYPVNTEDENFVTGPDGKTYMLPPNNGNYIADTTGQKQQLKVPPTGAPFTKNPTSDYDPITALKNNPPGKRLPPGTTADRTPRRYIPENSRISDVNLEPSVVNIGGIRDIDADVITPKRDEIFGKDALGVPNLEKLETEKCHGCKKLFEDSSIAVQIDRANAKFHAECFRCFGCNQNLADLLYFYDKDSDQIYCGRDYAKIRGIPRCVACDELIFVKEYCLAENTTFHVKHFCCFECDMPLAGQNYVMEESQPMCLSCYESVRASKCVACGQVIQPDQRGAQLQNLHFHVTDECFCCRKCRKPLLGAKLLLRNEKLYCSGICFNQDQ